MATTITAAKLTVNIDENIVLNGKQQGNRTSVVIPSIASVFSRIINCPTSEITLYTTDATVVGGSQLDEDNIKYVRVTNKDDTNYVTLTLANDRSEEVAIKLAAKHSFVLWGHKTGFEANQVELAFTDATVDTTHGAFTATCDASAKIKVGQSLVGTGVAPSTTVATVNTPGAVTSFTMSNTGSGTETNTSCVFTGALADITSMTGLANTAACDVEIFIAST